jgi:hypothetical protein
MSNVLAREMYPAFCDFRHRRKRTNNINQTRITSIGVTWVRCVPQHRVNPISLAISNFNKYIQPPFFNWSFYVHSYLCSVLMNFDHNRSSRPGVRKGPFHLFSVTPVCLTVMACLQIVTDVIWWYPISNRPDVVISVWNGTVTIVPGLYGRRANEQMESGAFSASII